MASAAPAIATQIPTDVEPGAPVRVLFVEDDQQDVELCARELEQAGFKITVSIATSARELIQAICTDRFDVILSDYGLPGWHGDEVSLVRNQGVEIPRGHGYRIAARPGWRAGGRSPIPAEARPTGGTSQKARQILNEPAA